MIMEITNTELRHRLSMVDQPSYEKGIFEGYAEIESECMITIDDTPHKLRLSTRDFFEVVGHYVYENIVVNTDITSTLLGCLATYIGEEDKLPNGAASLLNRTFDINLTHDNYSKIITLLRECQDEVYSVLLSYVHLET